MPKFPNEYEPDNTDGAELTEYAAALLNEINGKEAAGVTHGNRQTLLEHLTRYRREDITLTLQRERNNAYDSNAVQIIAAVRNKGAAVIGYINRELAAALAPLLDKGATIASRFKAIVGGGCGYYYGLELEIKV